jgi:CRP/FNR family transcriptional regulator, anaerobic regulatory protein
MHESDAERALRTACAEFAEIPEVEWRHFWSQVRSRNFAPRQHIVREGHPSPCVHFIVSGLVRLYYNRDGRELVRGFDFEGRWATAYESVLTGEPASFSIEALEPTHTVCFTSDTLVAAYNRHPCWDRFGRRILEAQWIRQSDKARRFRVYSAEEHYRLLIARRSPIIDRVPLNQLASFLQITPETLSRIRARIRDEGEQPAGVDSQA